MVGYIAKLEDASQLIAAYLKFQSTHDSGHLNNAARIYCNDEFNETGDLVCPDDKGLAREVALACQEAVAQANRYNTEIAKKMLSKLQK